MTFEELAIASGLQIISISDTKTINTIKFTDTNSINLNAINSTVQKQINLNDVKKQVVKKIQLYNMFIKHYNNCKDQNDCVTQLKKMINEVVEKKMNISSSPDNSGISSIILEKIRTDEIPLETKFEQLNAKVQDVKLYLEENHITGGKTKNKKQRKIKQINKKSKKSNKTNKSKKSNKSKKLKKSKKTKKNKITKIKY
jgi:hypothetical protein